MSAAAAATAAAVAEAAATRAEAAARAELQGNSALAEDPLKVRPCFSATHMLLWWESTVHHLHFVSLFFVFILFLFLHTGSTTATITIARWPNPPTCFPPTVSSELIE